MSLLPLSMSIAAVVLALAAFYFLVRKRASNTLRGPKVGLLAAASTIYKTVQRERMPLLISVKNSGEDPAEWFASSIAGVVPVCRRNALGFEECCWGDCEPQSLYIRQRDVRTYLRWARTVQ